MVKEMMKMIGSVGLVRDGAISYSVQIMDVTMCYGGVRYQVIPLCGEGIKWIAAESFKPTNMEA